jgi:hypothetical protein
VLTVGDPPLAQAAAAGVTMAKLKTNANITKTDIIRTLFLVDNIVHSPFELLMNDLTERASVSACATLPNKGLHLIVQGCFFDLVVWHKRNSPPLKDFVLIPVVMRTTTSAALGYKRT